jgi:hypothetical protein
MDISSGVYFKQIIPTGDFVIMAALPWCSAMHTSN